MLHLLPSAHITRPYLKVPSRPLLMISHVIPEFLTRARNRRRRPRACFFQDDISHVYRNINQRRRRRSIITRGTTLPLASPRIESEGSIRKKRKTHTNGQILKLFFPPLEPLSFVLVSKFLENVFSKVREQGFILVIIIALFVYEKRRDYPRVELRPFAVFFFFFFFVSKLNPASHFILRLPVSVFPKAQKRFRRCWFGCFSRIVVLFRREFKAVRVSVVQIHSSEQFARHLLCPFSVPKSYSIVCIERTFFVVCSLFFVFLKIREIEKFTYNTNTHIANTSSFSSSFSSSKTRARRATNER